MRWKADNPPAAPCPDRSTGQSAAATRRVGIAGVMAALACTLGCCLPVILMAVGVGASATAGVGHAAHGARVARGWPATAIEVLHRVSPVLLIASIVLVAVAFATRRTAAVLPALIAGAVLYVSVHGQSDQTVMFVGMAVGYGAWIALYLWTRPRTGAGSCVTSAS